MFSSAPKTNHLGVIFIVLVIVAGIAQFFVVDPALKDGFLGMQAASLLCAAYAYWKFLKRT